MRHVEIDGAQGYPFSRYPCSGENSAAGCGRFKSALTIN